MKPIRFICIMSTIMLLLIFGSQICIAETPPPYPGERVKGKEAVIKVAACQMEPHIGDIDYNLNKMIEFIDKAADQGATLIVLPELANTGYMFNSREEAFSLAEPVPNGPTTNLLMK